MTETVQAGTAAEPGGAADREAEAESRRRLAANPLALIGWIRRLAEVSPERADALERAGAADPKVLSTADYARMRLLTFASRQWAPAIAAAVAILYIGPLAAVLVVAFRLAYELTDVPLHLYLLHRAPADRLARPELHQRIALQTTFAAGMDALTAMLFWFAPNPDLKLFTFAYMTLAALQTAIGLNQLRELQLARQSVFFVLMFFLCLLDVATAGLNARTTLQVLVTLLIAARFRAWINLMLENYEEGAARQRELEVERDRANRALDVKSEFIAAVSHELRTPLNGILGMAQSLLGDPALSPRVRRQVQVIADSGRTLTSLLSDVLDRSRLDAGQLDIVPVEESLADAVGQVANLYRPLAEERGVALSVSFADDLPERLVFDPVRVRQCLNNLVSNAVKFTDTGSIAVSVRVRALEPQTDGRCRITIAVSDTGIGISEEAQDRLFRPFSQADSTIGRRFGGSGLGLDISRRLSRMMGGDIWVVSRPGKGSTFEFSFEASRTAERGGGVPAGPRRPVRRSRALAGARVLVVDDVATNRAVMRLFLQPLEIEVIEAADATTALNILREEPVDAALIDLHMPDIDGIELMRRIRGGRAIDPAVPAIAVTADTSARADTLAEAGFDDLVLKPIDQRGLESVLTRVLTGPRPERAAPGTAELSGS
ncbi:MAG TPA: ATP-binding protein [Thermohalobaculum sp.]|nr:ATP-binding protein [Thermohalobaculum sp.]